MFLYLLLNLGAISIPLLYSFEKNMRFIKDWKAIFLSITIVATVFLIWDVLFTANGVWGFNPSYHLSILLFGMPLEGMDVLFLYSLCKCLYPLFSSLF